MHHLSRIVPGIALATVLSFPTSTAAQGNSGLAELRGNDTIVSAQASDSKFGAGLGYFTHGAVLYALWNESGSVPVPHTGGNYKFIFSAGTALHEIGHNLELCHNGPVVLVSGPEVLFVASDNGRLYKLDAFTGAVLGFVDVRRPGCPADKIKGTPAVQLYQQSNPVFQSAVLGARGHGDDLVFVITHQGCGDNNGNRVVAYWASDLTMKWEFNATGSYSMSAPVAGCEVDYATNTIYLATDQGQAGQHTLWAFETLPATAQPAPKWSTNAGSIQNRPTLGAPGELFLARTGGFIEDRDPATGSVIWTMPTGSPVVRNLRPEVRPGLPTRLFFVTEDGNLHGILQNFPSPVVLWPPTKPPTAKFSTIPAVASSLGKGFIGRDDGRVQMVQLSTGLLEVSAPAGTPGTLWDPVLDYSGPTAPEYDRLMITTTEGSDRRYCIVCGTTEVPHLRPVEDFSLAQSAPNPFTTRTRIEYRLPYDARVEIRIYGVDGRKVRTVVDEPKSAGVHATAWDGLDDTGSRVEPGVYFYRLHAKGDAGRTFERSKKIQLIH